MKVIGAGFGRTGTTSLKRALEILGFGPCYHFTEMLRAGHWRKWLAVANGAPPDWDDVFLGFESTTDWPAAAYFRELAVQYPDAKVILTTRDADDWYKSVRTTIYALQKAVPTWLPGIRGIGRLTDAVIWEGTFHGRLVDRDHAIAVFEQHTRDVIANTPLDRLLVFDVREGWGPLCEFLEVPVPENLPFPHVNDSRHTMRLVRLLRMGKVLLPAAVALVGVSLAVRLR